MRCMQTQVVNRLTTFMHNNAGFFTAKAKLHATYPMLDTQDQVMGLFNYYNRPGDPALDDLAIIDGTSSHNKSYRLPVKDLRSLSTPLSDYTHTKHGFQIFQQPLPISPSRASVDNTKTITGEYYPAMVALLKEKLGARSVIVRNHSLRDRPKFSPGDVNANTGFRAKHLAPFYIAHSDHPPAGTRAHFRAMQEPEWLTSTGVEDGCTTVAERKEFFQLRGEIIAAENEAIREAGLDPDANDGGKSAPSGGHWAWDGSNYKGRRYAYFSVWRPWEQVLRDPLAVMDMNDPAAHDIKFVPLTRTYHSRPGCSKFFYSQNNLLRAPDFGSGQDQAKEKEAGHHAWRYLNKQTPEEVYLITFYDSLALLPGMQGNEGVQIACPHAAFQIEGTDNVRTRRSIELRVWCIW